MPKRVKPNLSPAAFPVHSLEDVDAALAQIAARKRQIDLIGLGVAEQVDEIKTRAAAETEPIRLELPPSSLLLGGSPKQARRNCSAKRSLYSPVRDRGLPGVLEAQDAQKMDVRARAHDAPRHRDAGIYPSKRGGRQGKAQGPRAGNPRGHRLRRRAGGRLLLRTPRTARTRNPTFNPIRTSIMTKAELIKKWQSDLQTYCSEDVYTLN